MVAPAKFAYPDGTGRVCLRDGRKEHGMAGGTGDASGATRSDEDLIAAARAGERGAADDLARRHYPAVLAALARQLGDPEEARDVAQDTFLAAFRGLAGLRTPRLFAVWLRRIARNQAHQAGRRRAQAPAQIPLEQAPEAPAPALTREQRLVRRALERLSPADREVLLLDGVGALTGAEIAAALGISRVAAYARLARARGRFVARYADEMENG